jgi:hypothetical protein
MSDLILASDNGIITPAANAIVNMGENDPFQIAFRPAKPTLDAVRWLRPCFRFIDACSRRGRPLFREQEAAKMVAKLPTVEKLAEAGKLFDAAVTEKAPSSWVHAVLALMADSQPNPSTSDGWRFGLARQPMSRP